jgi:hypothetical protein
MGEEEMVDDEESFETVSEEDLTDEEGDTEMKD